MATSIVPAVWLDDALLVAPVITTLQSDVSGLDTSVTTLEVTAEAQGQAVDALETLTVSQQASINYLLAGGTSNLITSLSARSTSPAAIGPASTLVVRKGTVLNNLIIDWTRGLPATTQSLSNGITAALSASALTYTATGTFSTDITVRLNALIAGVAATRDTSVSFRLDRFWGLCADNSPTDGEILAMAHELSTSGAARKVVTLSPANQFVVYVQPAAWPIAATVGFGSTTTNAFTDTIRTIVNEAGSSDSYRIRVLTFPLTVTEEFTF